MQWVAFMVIEVCHRALSCLFVVLSLRKVTWKCEIFPDRDKQSMPWVLTQISFFESLQVNQEAGGPNIHTKQSLPSQNLQSNFGHKDISSEHWSCHSSTAGSLPQLLHCLLNAAQCSLLGSFVWIQQVPYIRTFELWAFKDVNTCLHIQSRKLVHVSGVHCHMCASSTSGCAFVYFTILYRAQWHSIFVSNPGYPETSVKAVLMELQWRWLW